MNRNRIAIVAALAVSLFSSVASATTLNLVQPNTSRGSFVTFNFNGSDETGFAGPLSFSINGSSTLYDFFCVDLTTMAIQNSPYEAMTLPVTVINNGERVAWMFLNLGPAAQSVLTGTALQLAIWDVVHDGGNGLSAGVFQATASISSAIIAQAESYISASVGQQATGAAIYESVLGPNDRQLQIGQVPEPGTFVLLVSGLVLAGFGARRKRA